MSNKTSTPGTNNIPQDEFVLSNVSQITLDEILSYGSLALYYLEHVKSRSSSLDNSHRLPVSSNDDNDSVATDLSDLSDLSEQDNLDTTCQFPMDDLPDTSTCSVASQKNRLFYKQLENTATQGNDDYTISKSYP